MGPGDGDDAMRWGLTVRLGAKGRGSASGRLPPCTLEAPPLPVGSAASSATPCATSPTVPGTSTRGPWASAAARARGKDHLHAVRITARAWSYVIWRCRQDGTAYDPAKHNALQRTLDQHASRPADARPEHAQLTPRSSPRCAHAAGLYPDEADTGAAHQPRCHLASGAAPRLRGAAHPPARRQHARLPPRDHSRPGQPEPGTPGRRRPPRRRTPARTPLTAAIAGLPVRQPGPASINSTSPPKVHTGQLVPPAAHPLGDPRRLHEAFLSLACAIICWRRLTNLSICYEL
jgi:hypothetical protein